MSLELFRRQLAKRGQTITLQNRDIAPPVYGSADFGEDFTGDNDVTALVCTERGKTLFDGVATDKPITHIFKIEYVAGVTSETWVELKGSRYDIIDVENCCEADEILWLRSTERGTGEAAKA